MSYFFVTTVVGMLMLGWTVLAAQPVMTAPSPAVSSSSPTVFQTFAVYSHQPGKKPHYVPSGYMGDSDLVLSATTLKADDKEDVCLKVNYRGTGPKGWAGLYWQDPANNWGERPGRAGYDLRGAARLSFRARGEAGGERVQKFRVGGIVGRYPDSDVAQITNVRLTKEWKRYEIDLTGKDLRHIIGGFGLSLNKAENGGGAILYIDDIVFEGSLAQTALTQEAGAPPVGQPPVPPAPELSLAAAQEKARAAQAKDLEIKEVDTGLKVSFSSSLLFASGKSVLEAPSGKVLDQLIALLAAYPKNRVLVEGHTDSTGDKTYNLKLSELRAKAVRDYLIKRGGYESSRFSVTGYGVTKPVADNKTRAGRSLNRRVEVTILKSVNP